MRLRTSTALKLFAILLFSFELIAPALISQHETITRSGETQLYSREGHFTAFISSLVCEENAGEEDERASKDHKNSMSICDFDINNVFAELTITENRQTLSVEAREITSAQPPLFTLFHTYLI